MDLTGGAPLTCCSHLPTWKRSTRRVCSLQAYPLAGARSERELAEANFHRPGLQGAHQRARVTPRLRRHARARRVQSLDEELVELDARRTALVLEVAPALLNAFGVGPDSAATLLMSVRDNPRTTEL